jgi:hypothetical protein
MSHYDYTKDLYQAARVWLTRGCSLLPCQHNSKYYVSGFGPARRSITSIEMARRFFEHAGYNLAILLPKNLFCLDFDDWELFCTWSDALPAELQTTYQETTPRGAHIVYRGDIPPGIELVAGVEVKRACLVAPSVVSGRRYVDLGYTNILAIADYKCLISSLLSEDKQPETSASSKPVTITGSGDLVDRIKRAFPITELISQYTEIKPSGAGEKRWFVGLCPFHQDHRPSMWVDAERGLWGCHACGITGDAINFYGRQHHLTLQGAIRDLAGRLPRV